MEKVDKDQNLINSRYYFGLILARAQQIKRLWMELMDISETAYLYTPARVGVCFNPTVKQYFL